ncbi:peptidyl-tRNA hydrolase PTH2-domain-containing protein [Microdochium trichocladiopsis]|uniref:peptidyl-tRNA hydrolase n=1 Tax=Microdochium trichocladiopsis TaxID=1682393 RepID=A0A9P9BW39_9PEZI|nr:peptidyl-tRNA hydrolase PTH2-domain-containing protein [Microdochium trichocladiopsis]KAH7040215.1 peptidyl-tRNA hydrolase PTH2-domain-containing protein [Microdochium trichocladiopsis]
MADTAAGVNTTAVILSTSIVTFITGFFLGIYSIRGYLISPSLRAERAANLKDPVESDESDIDEDDTILDHAPNWTNGLDADRRQGLRVTEEEKSSSSTKDGSQKKKKKGGKKGAAEENMPKAGDAKEGNANEECKLVLVVRTDLGMTKGKIAAQCSHATLACYKTLSRAQSKNPSSAEARILQRWERLGQAKIAVQVKSEDEMLELMGKARSLGITAEVIQDAGRTQIDPGSLTVLGVGPAPKSQVDLITGGLKLL